MGRFLSFGGRGVRVNVDAAGMELAIGDGDTANKQPSFDKAFRRQVVRPALIWRAPSCRRFGQFSGSPSCHGPWRRGLHSSPPPPAVMNSDLAVEDPNAAVSAFDRSDAAVPLEIIDE